ncbi:DUF4199 domain-containing protein [Arcticibacter sp. MXS-1]|uniref:DUF4199 domain-containing protein n=1 Tax=Arcticibacter sp. MXS-1 TaxID=3341726 RepID=UPI0035A857A7
METTYDSATVRKAAVMNGLIWSFINIVLFLIVYYVKPDLMGSMWWGIFSFVLALVLAVYFSLDLRKKAGGFWSFKEALSMIFTMFIVSALIVYLFTVVFGKFLEPNYVTTMKEITTNNTVKMFEKMGMDQDAIDKATKDVEVKMEKQFNPGLSDLLISIGTMVIIYFVGALIFAAIFKKQRPYTVPVTEE